MLIVAVVLVIFIVILYKFSNKISIGTTPPAVIMTYEKMSRSGNINDLDLFSNGRYEIKVIKDSSAPKIVRSGVLNRAQMAAFRRLFYAPPSVVNIEPTIADNMISKLFYRGFYNNKVIYLGVMDPVYVGSSYPDLMQLDDLLNVIA